MDKVDAALPHVNHTLAVGISHGPKLSTIPRTTTPCWPTVCLTRHTITISCSRLAGLAISIRGITLYVRLCHGKFWIEDDMTEEGIATDLLQAGVPKEDIVLAFQPPEARQFTGVRSLHTLCAASSDPEKGGVSSRQKLDRPVG